MDRENFVITLILRAHDEMGAALNRVNRQFNPLRKNIDDTHDSMQKLDRQSDRTTSSLTKLERRSHDTARSIGFIRGPTDNTHRSVRRLGDGINWLDARLGKLHHTVNENRESIAKFDNELRGMRVLIIAAQLQALSTAVTGLAGALTAVGASAVQAGAALGGALAAGAAQAIPAIGLLATTLFRVKQVADVLQQIQLAQKQAASQATSATNKQADSVDKLTTANETLVDAQRSVKDAHEGVSQAIADQRRELEDLLLAQRSAALQQEQSVDRLRLLRAQGTTGFELRGAELDVEESRVRARRSRQDLTQARTGTPEGVRTALRQLSDAEQALARARRGMANARRDSQEAGIDTVGAARQLQFLRSQLSDAENALVDSVGKLRETWKRVARPVTDTIIESFTRATNKAEEVIQRPSLINAFQTLADKASGQIDRITRSLTSDRSIAFFERTTRRTGENLKPLTSAFLSITRAFMNIADAAAPVLHGFVLDIRDVARGFEHITENQSKMRGFFEFGRIQLHAWWELVRSIGNLLIAIMAPGGDLQSGAGASGLRIIRGLTLDIRRGTEWINEHPLDVKKFFGDSEEVFSRILELVLDIAKTMLEMFDPGTVDAFADIITALLPSFQAMATTFGLMSKFFAALANNPIARFAMQTAFGFLIFQRLLTRFGGFFSAMLAAILGSVRGTITIARTMDKIALTLGTIITESGGLTSRIQAATAAWKGYGAAGVAANEEIAASSVAATRGRPRIDPRTGAVVAGPNYGRNPAIFGPAPTGPIVDERGRVRSSTTGRFMSGRLAPFAGSAERGAAGVRALFGGLGGLAGSLVIGTLAISAINNYNRVPEDSTLTPRQQRLAGRARGPLERALGDQPGSLREAIQPGFLQTAFGAFNNAGRIQDIADNLTNVEDKVRKLARAGNERGLGNLSRQIHSFAEEVGGTKGKLLENFADGIDQIRGALRKVGDSAEGIVNRQVFQQVQDRIADLRTNGVNSIKELREQMRITFNFIGDAAEKGSNAWRIQMIDNTQAGVEGLLAAANSGKIKWRDAMEEITRITRRQMRLVRGHIKDLSGEARDALSENFRTARVRAERQLGKLEDATGRSLTFLKRLMANELASYGFTSSQVRRIIRAKVQGDDYKGPRGSRGFEDTTDNTEPNQAVGGWVGRPMGGFIGAMGERGQDAIRTVLGRGEAVLNWGQQKLVEPALNAAYGFGLDHLFKRTRGMHAGTKEVGYASGGRIPIVPVPGFPGERANRAILDEIAYVTKRFGLRLTDAYGPGHQSPGHTIYGTAADFAGPDRSMNAAVKFLASRYKVLYDGRFGSTAWPGHGPSTVAGSNAHLHVEFGTKDLAAATGNMKPFNIPHVEITGAGPMGGIASAVLAKVRRAAIMQARRAIQRSLMAGTEGSEMGGGAAPPGQLRTWLRRALAITGHSGPGNLSALYGRAMQESGGNPRAVNNWDSNAAAGHPSKGLLQTIDSTFAAYSLPGMKNIFNPIHNAVAAIRYMYANYGHIVGPSSSGYAAGGELPGPLGRAQSVIAHGKEWILNEAQKSKIAQMAGTSVGALKSRLGFSGGPSSFQGGGEVFDQQEFLGNRLQPLNFRGLARIVRALFEHMQDLNKKGKDTFENINSNIDQLTREGGLLDQIDVAIDRAVENMVTNATFQRFRRGHIIRSTTRGEAFEARAELGQLTRTGRLLNRENRFVGRALGSVGDRIRAIRRGGVDDDEEGALQDLLTQRRNLTERRRGIRGRLAENIRARFEAQQRVIETALEKNLRASTEGLRVNELAQRVAQAFGRGGESSFIGVQIGLLQQQVPIIKKALNQANRQGNTALADQLRGQMQDIQTQIQELIAQRMQAQMDEVEKRFGRAQAGLGLRERMLTALGRVGLGGGQGAIFAERGTLLTRQRNELIALRAQATADRNIGAVETLTDQINELGVQIVENTSALFQARIEDVNRKQSLVSNLSGTRGRIIELQQELGIITPQQSQQALLGQLGLQRGALEEQRSGLQGLLADAVKAGNQAAFNDLTQQLADNELALLENTKSVNDLNGSLTAPQEFSSTAWQWFRNAIFTGSGSLLPQFQMPALADGGTVLSTGMAVVHKGEWFVNPQTGSGPGGVAITVNEAGGPVDVEHLASRMQWEMKGRRS